ncbi:MAG: DnaJ C-terminal domain-containing protein [Leptolyngbyaceae cyanobacterium]
MQWLHKRVFRKLGYVADFCPICGTVRPFALFKLRFTPWLTFGVLPTDPRSGKLAEHVGDCQKCSVRIPMNVERYRSISQRLSADINADLPVLTQETFPNVREHYRERFDAMEILWKNPESPQAKKIRASLIEEPFWLLAPLATERSMVDVEILTLLALGIAGVVLMFLHADEPVPQWSFWVGLPMTLGPLLPMWVIVMLARQRFLRKKQLQERLNSLQPTLLELQTCVNTLRQKQYPLRWISSGQKLFDFLQSTGQRGDDLRIDLTLSFLEAVFGCPKTYEITHFEYCSACSGIGNPLGNSEYACRTCGGSGCESKTIKLKTIIPAGIESGSRLRVSGEGDVGRHRSPPGDLYVYLFVENHPHFQRNEVDILSTVTVTADQSKSGCALIIETLDGKVKVDLPPNTPNNAVLRISGIGVPHLGDPTVRGDQLVTVTVSD